MKNITIKIPVIQQIAGKPVVTRFTSTAAAERYASAVGGKVGTPARTAFGNALARAIGVK